MKQTLTAAMVKEQAKALGADVLRLWCGNKNSEDYTESEKNEEN